MFMYEKYIWIWEVNRCESGNMDEIIKRAKDIGISGFILKTHDGSSLWHQSTAINEFKSAGLKCGAWGYCYGHNVSGEIEAIKKIAALEPDFYVLDVEAEFEAPGMRDNAEQLASGVKELGVRLGYTTFAIPHYHTSFPFDIFSKYCSFTMPQIYWLDMGMSVNKAFNMSLQEYAKFGLPVYPVGESIKQVSPQDIKEFEKLSLAKNLRTISYWSYQDTADMQLDAIDEGCYLTLNKAIYVLNQRGIVGSPEYWLQNAIEGKTVNGLYAAILIIKAADKVLNRL